MTKILITFLFVNLCVISAFAQNDSLQVTRVNRDTIDYWHYIQNGNKIFAINKTGKLKIWDLDKFDTISFKGNQNKIKYSSVAKDVHNNIFVSATDGSVFKLSAHDYSPSLYLKIKRPIQRLAFNSKNALFLVTQAGVYDTESKRYWNKFTIHAPGLLPVKKRKLIFFKESLKNGYFSSPQYVFLDNQDRLWMSASYGEFGTDMEVFDTGKRKILDSLAKKARNTISNPNSFFNDDQGNLYITAGLQHFMNWGNISRIDKNDVATELFDGKIKGTENRMFIGPGAFNKTDNSIYFATTSGFFKAPVKGDDFTPQFLFKTNLSWSREPMAIGVAMTIKQVSFTEDNKLLFLTTNNGFGIYDGKKLILFK